MRTIQALLILTLAMMASLINLQPSYAEAAKPTADTAKTAKVQPDDPGLNGRGMDPGGTEIQDPKVGNDVCDRCEQITNRYKAITSGGCSSPEDLAESQRNKCKKSDEGDSSGTRVKQ